MKVTYHGGLEGLRLKLQYLATWYKEPTHWKRPGCWERLKAKGEQGDRGRDGCMASPIQWTWVWASSGRWWRTGNPDVLQFMKLQRTGHDLATEHRQQSWTASTSESLRTPGQWSGHSYYCTVRTMHSHSRNTPQPTKALDACNKVFPEI